MRDTNSEAVITLKSSKSYSEILIPSEKGNTNYLVRGNYVLYSAVPELYLDSVQDQMLM